MEGQFNIDEIVGSPKTRWFPFMGRAEFFVQYATPLQVQRWRRRLVHEGVMRETKSGGFEVAPGRDMDYYRSVAAEFVKDWRGKNGWPIVYKGVKDAPYDPEGMALAIAHMTGLLKMVTDAVEDEAGFFDGGAPKNPAD